MCVHNLQNTVVAKQRECYKCKQQWEAETCRRCKRGKGLNSKNTVFVNNEINSIPEMTTFVILQKAY